MCRGQETRNYGDLNGTALHRLLHLNAWPTVSGTIWKGFGGTALLEVCLFWELALRFQKHFLCPVSSLFLCLVLWTLANFYLLLQFGSQTYLRLPQRPWWKDKEDTSSVSLSKSRLGKVQFGARALGLERVADLVSGNPTFFPWGLWLSDRRQLCLRYPGALFPALSDLVLCWSLVIIPLQRYYTP